MNHTSKELLEILTLLEGRPVKLESDVPDSLSTREVVSALLETGECKNGLVRPFADDLKETAEEKRLSSRGWQLPEENLANVHHLAGEAAQAQSVPYYTPIPAGGIRGRLMAAPRKLARRFLEFIFAPVLGKQNSFNGKITGATIQLLRETEENLVLQNRCMDILRKENLELRAACDSLLVAQAAQQKDFEKLNADPPMRNKVLESRLDWYTTQQPIAGRQEADGPAVEAFGSGLYAALDYVRLYQALYGNEAQVRARYKQYLPVLPQNGVTVDLGCGRGEMMELLREAGNRAAGVDIYPAFVECCREKALDVACGDAEMYLSTLEDGALDAVTGMRLLEHLPASRAARLVEIAGDKLRQGGVLLLECVNPANAGAMAGFYADPTRNKPVHPAFLAYCARKAGFGGVGVLYEGNEGKLQSFPVPEGSLDGLGKTMEQCDALTASSPFYALFAVK